MNVSFLAWGNLSSKRPSPPIDRAFSFVEVFITLSVMAVVAASAYVVAGNVTKNTQLTKLEIDVTEINTSIRMYLASGGNLTGVSTPQQIIDKLKTSRTAEADSRYSGLSSSMADARLKAVMQTASEAAASNPRAVWNSGNQRFEIAGSGPIGVKHFTLDDSLASVDYGTENRDPSMVDINPEDGWIWTYNDTQASAAPEPTNVPFPPASSGGGSSGTGSSSSSSGSSGSEGSSSGSTDGSSDSGSGGDGNSDDGGDGDDGPPPPQRLYRPQIYPTTTKQPETNFPLTITITDYNDPATSDLKYKVDGGSWATYAGGFQINANQRVEARAFALNTATHTDSSTRSRTYRPLVSSFTGNLSPTWTNATGGQNLEYEITTGGTTETTLTHGDTTLFIGGEEQEAGTANMLTFEANSFGAELDQQFSLGEMSFFNGSTFNQSDADSVTLSLVLDLSEPIESQQTVNIPLSLTSTPNSDDPYDSADKVSLDQQSFNLSGSINGVSYRLRIEFGPAQAGGFGTGSTISAFEGAEVTAEIYGKFEAR